MNNAEQAVHLKYIIRCQQFYVLFFKHVKRIVSFSVFKAFYGYLLFIFGISMLRHVPIL